MDANGPATLLETWGYPALLALLVLTGVGSPVPEDLLLLTAGYLVFAGIFDWPLALTVSITGVVVSDLMLYSAGRHLAWHSEQWPEGRLLSAQRLQRVTMWFTRWGSILILVARLTPGTRAVVFVTAGLRAVPVQSFFRYDVLGAALWVPLMLAIGHAVGRRFGDLRAVIDWLNSAGAWGIVIVGALTVIWLWLGREESKL